MVSDGGGGPSDQSSGLPIDRASHESSRSRARTRSSPLKHGWYCLLEHLTFHPCRRFRRTARRHTFFVLDRMENQLLMIEQACRLPARCALSVPADSPSMGPSGRRASVSSWRDAFGDKVSCAKLLAQIVDHAYDRWNINRIQATTDLDNHASIGLLRSLGFIEQGIMRRWGYWKDAFHDVRLFSLIKAQRPIYPTA